VISIAAHESGGSRRVLLAAPTIRDSEVTTSMLARAGLTCLACEDLRHLSREIEHGVGVILLTDDVFNAPAIDELVAALKAQPAWSEPPVVILMNIVGLAPAAAPTLQALGNVTVLERPAPMRSVISTVQAALRGRERQYLIRDQIEALQDAEQRARQLQQHLELALHASELGTSLERSVQSAFLARAGRRGRLQFALFQAARG
jgi:hypothetical protein